MAPDTASRRIHRLSRQLASSDKFPTTREAKLQAVIDWFDTGLTQAMLEEGELPRDFSAFKQMPRIRDLAAEQDYDLSAVLPGPLQDVGEGKRYAHRLIATREHLRAIRDGKDYALWAEYQRRYGGDGAGLATNIVVPRIMVARNETTGIREETFYYHLVVLSDPDDCARIARIHLRKDGAFTPGMFGSLISTRDNEHWRTQRENLVVAFLPRSSLAKVFPVSVARAAKCTELLEQARLGAQRAARSSSSSSGTSSGEGTVDMSEFLLNETQAQLQLALFGEDEAFMARTNAPFRRAMAGKGDPRTGARDFLMDVVDRTSAGSFVGPAEAAAAVGRGEAPPAIRGPLSAVLQAQMRAGDSAERGERSAYLTALGNANIFEFAGHDTTGHTLTWLLFELARAPALQRRLQAEVDEFWRGLEGRPMSYDDLAALPFMTRCITETLRLWPAVAAGTYRQLQFDDVCRGPGGAEVHLPKGTFVQITTIPRHRNPELWGADAGDFNPDRDFAPQELWRGGFKAYNPHTRRFAPFTHPPRDCIGKNFAQMEMRAILCHLLRDFAFSHDPLLAPLHEEHRATLGVSLGTMGPRDLTQPALQRSYDGSSLIPSVGMKLRVVRRR